MGLGAGVGTWPNSTPAGVLVMLLSDASQKVWLHTQPTDMRKSFTGLVALVKNVLQENPLDGQCFVFINRRKTQLKLLYFDGTGYCIWMKRLEQGQYHGVQNGTDKAAISWAELQMIIAGIEVKNIRRFKRFSREKCAA
jgi:transposase